MGILKSYRMLTRLLYFVRFYDDDEYIDYLW